MTPETDRTAHYFWAFCRNYNLGDQRITHALREGVTGVFGEDEVSSPPSSARSTPTPASSSTTSTSTAGRCGRGG